jgi:hypothetical protein
MRPLRVSRGTGRLLAEADLRCVYVRRSRCDRLVQPRARVASAFPPLCQTDSWPTGAFQLPAGRASVIKIFMLMLDEDQLAKRRLHRRDTDLTLGRYDLLSAVS